MSIWGKLAEVAAELAGGRPGRIAAERRRVSRAERDG